MVQLYVGTGDADVDGLPSVGVPLGLMRSAGQRWSGTYSECRELSVPGWRHKIGKVSMGMRLTPKL